MQQKLSAFIVSSSFDKSLFWSLPLAIILGCLSGYHVQANNINVPGLAIARYALPSISTNVDAFNPTETAVGGKIEQLKKSVLNLETKAASMVQSTRDIYEKTIIEVNQYHILISEVEAKLQLGTTPSNPKLIELKNKASHQLDQIQIVLGEMNGLSSNFFQIIQQIKNLSSQAKTMLQLPGAVDEDHAHLILILDNLTLLEGTLTRDMTIINTNFHRQSMWLSAERTHFTNLSLAINSGMLIASSENESVFKNPIPVAIPRPAATPKKVSVNHKKLGRGNLQKNTSSEVTVTEPPHIISRSATNEKAQSPKQPEKSISLKNYPIANEPNSINKTSGLSQAHLSTSSEKRPLPLININPYPRIHPLVEENSNSQTAKAQTQASQATIPYIVAAKGRSPLALLEPKEDVNNRHWYLFSSAKRGMNASSDIIDIVVIKGEQPTSLHRGKEVQALLIKMGIKPENLRLIQAIGEANQTGQVYLFGTS